MESEKKFLHAVFRIIEHINEAELRNSSKRLIITYINESKAGTFSEKGRSAISKHTQQPVPSLEDIRTRSKVSDIDALDHLVLKMEYEADRLQKQQHKQER
jgi:hypothetical protein